MDGLKKGYKFVFKDYYIERFYSLIINNLSLRVEYRLNKFVYPKDERFPLTVFHDLESAKYFFTDCLGWQHSGKSCKLFKCLYVKSNKPIIYYNMSIGVLNCENDVDKIYRCLSDESHMSFSYFPKGTIFADKVKLIEEIKIED